MKHTALVLFLCILCSCATGDQRLIGTWKSNRELTMETFKKRLSPEGIAIFDDLFGKMVVTYDKRKIHIYFPETMNYKSDWSSSNPYRVVHRDSESVTIQHADWLLPSAVDTTRIVFDGPDRYWIALGKGEDKEWFDRIAEQGAAANP